MRLSFCVALLALSPAALGDTLLVGPPGSGADFASLGLAVAAAQVGDQIFVLPGLYAGTTVTKGIDIIGAGADQTFISANSPFETAMAVAELPAGEHCHLAGMSFSSNSAVIVPYAVSIRDCAGAVSLDACRLESSDPQVASGALLVDAAELVFLSQTVLIGTDLSAIGQTAAPEPGVRVDGSTVVFDRCTVVGGTASEMTTGLQASDARGGDGVLALASTVVVTNSELRGGQGGGFLIGSLVGPGGSGLTQVGGVAILGGSTEILGADGKDLVGVGDGLGGVGLIVQGGAAVQIGPDVTLEGGLNEGTFVSAPAITSSAAATVVQLTESFTVLAAENDDSAGVARIDLSATGEPGRTLLLFADLGPAPASFLPLVAGPLVLDPITAREAGTLTLSGAGDAQLTVSSVAPAVLSGKAVTFQAIEIDPVTGGLRASLPTGTTLDF